MKKVISIALLLLLLYTNKAFGADLSKAHVWADGEVLTAALLSGNEDPLYSTINDLDGDNLASNIAITTSGSCTFSGTLSTTGTTNIGNGADTLAINCSSGITYTPAATWTFTEAQTVSGTWANLGSVTTCDINGGTIGGITIDGNWTAASQTCANLGSVTTADINGGTLDGVTIGGSSAGAGTFTSVTSTSLSLVPAGVILMCGGAVPTGWLACDGTAVSRTTYSALFTVISTAYGVGDGSTTFNLPNLVDKFARGSTTPGTGAGADTHTHEAGSFAGPSHTHTQNSEGDTGNTSGVSDFVYASTLTTVMYQTATGTSAARYKLHAGVGTGGTGAVTGTSAAGSTLPAYTLVKYIIKY